MTDINKLFFELIRVAIGNQVCLSHTPSADEWGELYAMAKKQSLVGVCFAGVQKLITNHPSLIVSLSEPLRLKWMGMAAKIQQRNEVVKGQCAELQNRLTSDGFRTCILKGQAVASLYNVPVFQEVLDLFKLRQSGDIDVWLDGSRDEIMDYVNKISPTEEVRWLHTQLKLYENTDVEVHFIPSYLECPWQDKALHRFFVSEKEACFAAGRCTDRFNQVFILAHAFRHLFGEGVGLRQLMDYYFVLKNSEDRLSREDFCKVMKETGMLRFAMAVMWIMNVVFGLEEEYLLCETSEREGEILLNEVMQSGNFGHHDERVKHSADENIFIRFIRLSLYNSRVIRFSPWIVICSPFWRTWHWCWRKSKGYK